ncbi:MAG: hypothetical protein JNK57_20550 [Planctomycetaceae bacterium]|nr:hypothetical protein [Planctomycetaceae bacterium]
MIESLIAMLNERYQRWSFVGSIVDWHYFNGQVALKDIDVVTSDVGEPDLVASLSGPRETFRWGSKRVEVFQGQPSAEMFESPAERTAKLEKLIELYPAKADVRRQRVKQYRALMAGKPVPGIAEAPKMAVSKVQQEKIANCAFRASQPAKKVNCNRGCCGTSMTRIYECLKHGPGKFVTLGMCENEKAVVAACIHCTMAKTAESMTQDELAELEARKSNHPGFK